MEARTRETYTYYLNKHILPVFGSMRINEIQPADVREWVSDLKAAGASPTVIRQCHTILSAVFTTAFNDQITRLHPCRGVKTPPVPKKLRTIITPDQFDQLYTALPTDTARLMAEVLIESGLRWAELIELRPTDLNPRMRMLTVSRVAVELVAKFHPTGGRFLIKDYPKDREHRRVKLAAHIADQLQAHITEHELGARRSAVHPDAARPAGRAVPPAAGQPSRSTSGSPNPTPPAGNTGTAPSPATTPAAANANTAATPTPPTAPNAAPPAKTHTPHRGPPAAAPSPPTATSPAPGSATTSGNPPSTPPASASASAPTTCATPTPPGSSPAEPTSKPSKNASATAASSPPRSTCTPSRNRRHRPHRTRHHPQPSPADVVGWAMGVSRTTARWSRQGGDVDHRVAGGWLIGDNALRVISLSAAQVIEMPVDELALRLVADLVTTNEWNEYNYLNSAGQHAPFASSRPALEAIAEALGWARAHGMIARAPGQTSDAAIFVTRAGRAAKRDGLSRDARGRQAERRPA